MAIDRSSGADGTTVTFRLAGDEPAGPVSVVGSFNDWTPGAHPFETDPDGSRSVTVLVPAGTTAHFRYLAADGHWFDDPQADEITGEGSVLRATETAGTAESAESTQSTESTESFESTDNSDVSDDTVAGPDAVDEAPEVTADTAAPAAPEEHPAATADETGDRLDVVAERIDEAKDAARDLTERDVLDPELQDEHRDAPETAQH